MATAASGGVIQDSAGKWLWGFARNIGYCNTYEYEPWGAHGGLDQAWKIGGRQVILELDCLAAAQQINSMGNEQKSKHNATGYLGVDAYGLRSRGGEYVLRT